MGLWTALQVFEMDSQWSSKGIPNGVDRDSQWGWQGVPNGVDREFQWGLSQREMTGTPTHMEDVPRDAPKEVPTDVPKDVVTGTPIHMEDAKGWPWPKNVNF